MGFFFIAFLSMRGFEIVTADFSIFYRFRDKMGRRGQKCHFRDCIIFLFFIQFWWDFSLGFLLNYFQPIFSISYRFWDKRGRRGQKYHFRGCIKFVFFIQFLWDFFFIRFLSMRAFSNCSSPFFRKCWLIFCVSYLFEIKGVYGAKNFRGYIKFGFFHPIFIGFI